MHWPDLLLADQVGRRSLKIKSSRDSLPKEAIRQSARQNVRVSSLQQHGLCMRLKLKDLLGKE